MTITRDSLGGQNSHRRVSGARSSRALSTIFRKLRKFDREIASIDFRIKVYGKEWLIEFDKKTLKRRAELDEKRRKVRLLRKGYTSDV